MYCVIDYNNASSIFKINHLQSPNLGMTISIGCLNSCNCFIHHNAICSGIFNMPFPEIIDFAPTCQQQHYTNIKKR